MPAVADAVAGVLEASFGGMVKCPECGMLNVKSAKACKKCKHDMKQVTDKAKSDGRSSVTEAADSMAKASTPEPFSKSKTSNWVARAGGLPAYIQHIAHDLVEKRGKSESQAIQMAIGIVKRWASGGGNVKPDTRAAAAKAVAEWEAMKGKNAAKSAAKRVQQAAVNDAPLGIQNLGLADRSKTLTCPSCGQPNKPTAETCERCGVPMDPFEWMDPWERPGGSDVSVAEAVRAALREPSAEDMRVAEAAAASYREPDVEGAVARAVQEAMR